MIPKIIHYCWFGGNPLPELAQKCIASWKKYFPDYEIKEWNESNYDVHKIPYISEAYTAKKYAFVSDYARFDILYTWGGIYFDTDVEVIKSFDDILKDGGFMGLEFIGRVAAGLGVGCNAGLGVGCNAGLGVVYQILEFYASMHFLNDDGSHNVHTVVEYVTTILKKHGLEEENAIQQLDCLTIYPCDYFSPKSFLTGKIVLTENTHSIHHYDASWFPEIDKLFVIKRRKIINIFGENIISEFLSRCLSFYLRITELGLQKAILYYINKLKKQTNA